ncbi:MAG: hypothetical protein P8Z76_07325 [Alphaproteobacteria bacterium]
MLSNSIVGAQGIRPIEIGRTSALSYAALAILLLASGWVAQSSTLNHDSGWYLQATRMLLEGGRLYQDIIEVNPPLAFILHVPPVWLGRVLGVSPIDLFLAWVFVAIGVSLVLCHVIIRNLPIAAYERTGLLAAVLAGLVLGSWQGLGQREHFVMIFTLPYLFLAVARASQVTVSWPSAGTIGTLAAIGFALKPHFLLIPLTIEVYLRVIRPTKTSLLRPETGAVALGFTACWAATAVFTPLYFSRIVPWALTTYDSYSASISDVLWNGETILLPAAILIYARVRRPGVLRIVIDTCLLAAVCFWLVHLIQMKGFPYHRFPIRTMLIVALGACLLAAYGASRSGRVVSGLRRMLPTAATGVLLVISLGWLVHQGTYKNRFMTAALLLLQAQVKSGAHTIYVFSSNVWQAFPAANYAGLHTVSRYPAHWLLPGTTQKEALPGYRMSASEQRTVQSIEQFVVNSVVEDFRRGKPDLVLVDVRRRKPHFGSSSFDYLKYFSADRRFAAIWSGYNRVATVKGFDFYSRRRP